MTETDTLHFQQKNPRKRRSCLCTAVIVIAVVLLVLIATVIILFFTLFKPKDPETHLISASVTGVAPRVSLPAVRIELNLTVDLQISVHNPNRASFKHGTGESQVFYRGRQVGEMNVSPGNIPARGSETVRSQLTLEVDRFAADLSRLISDVLAGELAIDVKTRVPGRITFLGIFKRHAVAVSECHITVTVPGLDVRQECSQKTKL